MASAITIAGRLATGIGAVSVAFLSALTEMWNCPETRSCEEYSPTNLIPCKNQISTILLSCPHLFLTFAISLVATILLVLAIKHAVRRFLAARGKGEDDKQLYELKFNLILAGIFMIWLVHFMLDIPFFFTSVEKRGKEVTIHFGYRILCFVALLISSGNLLTRLADAVWGTMTLFKRIKKLFEGAAFGAVCLWFLCYPSHVRIDPKGFVVRSALLGSSTCSFQEPPYTFRSSGRQTTSRRRGSGSGRAITRTFTLYGACEDNLISAMLLSGTDKTNQRELVIRSGDQIGNLFYLFSFDKPIIPGDMEVLMSAIWELWPP